MNQRSFSAFVRSASQHSAPFFRCSLAFTYNDNLRQATLSLRLNLPTSASPCFFVLEYGADIVAHGQLSRENFKEQFSNQHLAELQGQQNVSADFQECLLKIKRPCDVWCPRCPSLDFVPRCQSSFDGLRELSRATELLIYFDYNQVGKQHKGMFKAFKGASKGLAGYSLKEDLEKEGLERKSLDDFGRKDTINDADPPPALNDPPAYNETSSQYPATSHQKRSMPQSPTSSYNPEKTIPLSPRSSFGGIGSTLEDRAVAIQEEVSKQLSAHFCQDRVKAMNSAIETQLLTYLIENPETIKAAISEHLDKVLPTLLPNILETLLTGVSITRPGSTGASSISISSRSSRTPQSALQALLVRHLHLHYKKQLKRELETVAEEGCAWLDSVAYDIRAEVSEEVREQVQDGIFDIQVIMKDSISELEATKEELSMQTRQEAVDLQEGIAEHLSNTGLVRYDDVMMRKRRLLKKFFAVGAGRLRRGGRGISKGLGKGKASLSSQRRLLGMKRAELHEWTDC